MNKATIQLAIFTSIIILLSACQTGGKPAFTKLRTSKTKLKESAKKVSIINGQVPSSCKEIDSIVAGAALGHKQRRNYLKSKADAKGANAIKIESDSILRTTATAYKCL